MFAFEISEAASDPMVWAVCFCFCVILMLRTWNRESGFSRVLYRTALVIALLAQAVMIFITLTGD